MALLDDVKAVVVDQLDCDPAEVKEDSKFIEDLGADSLDVVELVMALDEQFATELPVGVAVSKLKDDEEITKNKKQTVGDAISYIENNK